MSACSFIIPPNVIPGRMALLVTLFLVQIDSVQKITVSLYSEIPKPQIMNYYNFF